MRCVHCGKALGRFRKEAEFCSEEHREQYRKNMERAALDRLLSSRRSAAPVVSIEPLSFSEFLPNAPIQERDAAVLQRAIRPLPVLPGTIEPSLPLSGYGPPTHTLRSASDPLSCALAAVSDNRTCLRDNEPVGIEPGLAFPESDPVLPVAGVPRAFDRLAALSMAELAGATDVVRRDGGSLLNHLAPLLVIAPHVEVSLAPLLVNHFAALSENHANLPQPAKLDCAPLESDAPEPLRSSGAAVTIPACLPSAGCLVRIQLPEAKSAMSSSDCPGAEEIIAAREPLKASGTPALGKAELQLAGGLAALELPESRSLVLTSLKKPRGPADEGIVYDLLAAPPSPVTALAREFETLALLSTDWTTNRNRLMRLSAFVGSVRDCKPELRGSLVPLQPRDALLIRPRARMSTAAPRVRMIGDLPARTLVRFWGDGRVKAGVVAMSLLLVFGSILALKPSSVEATSDAGPFDSLHKHIGRRAGVQLTDDFRTGLHNWEGGADWADSWSYDQAGLVQTGQLALYGPSIEMSDYSFEFVAQIANKSLGWVVRAADLKNYMAVKLVQTRSGPLPQVTLIRYAVIDGKEGPHKRVTVPLDARSDTVYHVRMEVRGERFSAFIQDHIADSWEDSRLPSGGVGLFSAKGEQARVKWVQITFQYDWLGRLCAALAG